MSAKVSRKISAEPATRFSPTTLFSSGFGILIGLSLLKFGNPCTFDSFVVWPENGFEWALNHWPIKVGYGLLAVLIVAGLFVARWRTALPRWLLILPAVWLLWQFVCAARTVDGELTRLTVIHFAACVVCFYLGLLCAGKSRTPAAFWLPVLVAFVIVIAWGLHQRFGGLEETRKYFSTYVYPHLESVSPEYLKKMSSDRIFSTLFYPNSLAGVLLLLLPPLSVFLWQQSTRFTFAARCFLVGCLGIGSLACLYWSGSKGGWLIALTLALIGLLHLRFSTQLKFSLVVAVLVVGIAGFAVRYAGFFQRGATSVVARFDYWRAGLQTVAANPVFGTGPGTFGESYKRIKKPESEMAKLAHNDYLQQATDSGLPACLCYTGWIIGILWFGYRKPDKPESAMAFCVWLGLLGWTIQGAMEFGLYIPAMAWTAFAISGLLLSETCNKLAVAKAVTTGFNK